MSQSSNTHGNEYNLMRTPPASTSRLDRRSGLGGSDRLKTNYIQMKKIEKEDYVKVFNELSADSSKPKVEVTTYNYESITGVVVKFDEENRDGALVQVQEEDGMINEIELDFIFEVILL